MAPPVSSPVATKNIVVLGGSYGGVSISHYLLKHAFPVLPARETYQITLVSTSDEVIDRPACPRALISDEFFDQDKLFVHIPPLFDQYPKGSFRFVHGTAVQLDHTNRAVSVKLSSGSTEEISFYALVIATGATTVSPLFGLNEGPDSLRHDWTAFREALKNAKSIVVAGGGPTGVETAGELGEHLNGRPGWFTSALTDPKVPITLVTADSKLLPVLRPSIAEKADVFLSKVGVTVLKNARVVSVAPEGAGTRNLDSKATLSLDNGKTLEADIYIPAMGTQANTSFVDKSLLQADGRVDVNVSTLRVDKAGPRVYAIGDASSFARAAVHNIIAAIPVLGANIKRDLLLDAGKENDAAGEDRVFKEDTRETQLVPIGTCKGVGSAMGYAIPSLMVWLIKGRDYWLSSTPALWSGKQWAKEA